MRFEAAGSTPAALGDAPRLTRDILVDGRYLGRIVAEGPAVRERPVAASLEAVALAIEHLAGAGGMPDAKAAADARSGIEAELALSRLQQRSIVSLQPPEVAGELSGYFVVKRADGWYRLSEPADPRIIPLR